MAAAKSRRSGENLPYWAPSLFPFKRAAVFPVLIERISTSPPDPNATSAPSDETSMNPRFPLTASTGDLPSATSQSSDSRPQQQATSFPSDDKETDFTGLSARRIRFFSLN